MMRFPAFVLPFLSVALFETGPCLAGDAGVAPQQAQPMSVGVPQAGIRPPAVLAPAAPLPPPVLAIPHSDAPAMGAFRSLRKAAPTGDPASVPAGKPDSSSPDVVVGGLPGAKSDASEKQP